MSISTPNIVNPKSSKTKHQLLLDILMQVRFPKPQQSNNNNDETKVNDNYSEEERRDSWIHCLDGSILFIQALEYAFFDTKEGLFRDEFYKNYLPFHMKKYLM